MMAIDSRDKRSSAVMVAMPFRSQLPAPDGAALSVGDRYQTGLMYRGLVDGAAPAPGAGEYIVTFRRRRRAA
jgi:hypothetical protein